MWLVGLVLSNPALAAGPLVVEGSSITRTYTCDAGQDVTVKGSNHRLTFDGDCGALKVEGSVIDVSIDGVKSISVDGSKITVGWKRDLSGQAKLPVTNTGTMNKISKVASAPASAPASSVPPLKVDGSSVKKTLSCQAGQGVVVTGSMHKLTIDGDCGELSVDGSSIAVTIDGVRSVVVDGSMNTVTWKRDLSGEKTLPVRNTGTMNKVNQAK